MSLSFSTLSFGPCTTCFVMQLGLSLLASCTQTKKLSRITYRHMKPYTISKEYNTCGVGSSKCIPTTTIEKYLDVMTGLAWLQMQDRHIQTHTHTHIKRGRCGIELLSHQDHVWPTSLTLLLSFVDDNSEHVILDFYFVIPRSYCLWKLFYFSFLAILPSSSSF